MKDRNCLQLDNNLFTLCSPLGTHTDSNFILLYLESLFFFSRRNVLFDKLHTMNHKIIYIKYPMSTSQAPKKL